MAEIEFELDGDYEPCQQTYWGDHVTEPCLSTIRAIRHVPTNMGKKLVCGNGHNQRGNDAFIGGWEFEEGEQFHGVVPDEYPRC